MSGGGVKDVSDDFLVEDATPARGPSQAQEAQRETDPHRLAQRQKQIDLGKNTLGYQRYRQAVARNQRNRRTDPMTPDVYQMCSKRAFEGQVKKWRRQLHAWDPAEDGSEPPLLAVRAQAARPASNPPPPAQERSDDFEHVTHADAAGRWGGSSTPDMGSPGSCNPGSKNWGALRQGAATAAGSLPLKIPSAMRKRSFDEVMTEADGNEENLQPQRNLQAQHHQAAPSGANKLLRRSREAEERWPPADGTKGPAGRTGSVSALSAPSWADQRFQHPELDYGASDDELEGGWQHVARQAPRQLPGQYKSVLPGQYKTVYNDLGTSEWDEEEMQI